MACMGSYKVLGYGCQERSTRDRRLVAGHFRWVLRMSCLSQSCLVSRTSTWVVEKNQIKAAINCSQLEKTASNTDKKGLEEICRVVLTFSGFKIISLFVLN